jgi:putative ABC transport system permease protein
MHFVTGPIQIAGFTQPPDGNPFDYLAATPSVTPEYFAVMGMRLVSGRGFSVGDDRAVVVNQAFVKRFSRDTEPLGKMLKANMDTRGPIVGVVNDARGIDPRQPAWPTIYYAAGKSRWEAETHLILRSQADNLEVLAGHARATVRGYSSRIPILSIATMDDLVGESVVTDRLNTLVFGTFALQALVLCLLGSYGVMSYSVSQRAKEFGVRMALGAGSRQVALLPMRQMFPFVTGGVLAGVLGALGLGRFLESRLFQVKPADPYTYLSVTVLFVIATAVACWIPARRASRADPLETLRCE